MVLDKHSSPIGCNTTTNATVVDDTIRFVTEHGKSITTVSATTRALKPKIDTVEDIKDAEHTPSSPSTTINQVF